MGAETTTPQTAVTGEQTPNLGQIGTEIFASLGLDAEASDRMGRIQLSAGGKCVGTLAEFIAVDRHAQIKEGVVKTVVEAQDTGADVEEAVAASLGLFVQRDEKGDLVRSEPVAQPDLKKN